MEERADAMAQRLQDAAERLRASAPPPAEPSGELSALEGLAHARLEVQRAQDAVERIGALLRDLDDR